MIETLLLFIAIILLWWLPGWLLLRAFLDKSLTLLEEVVFSFGIGLTLADALMLILDRLNVSLSRPTLAIAFVLINIVLGFLVWRKNKHTSAHTPESPSKTPSSLLLTPYSWLLLLLMLVLTIGIKAYYLVPAGLPTATDMGHHMYWSHFIVEKEFIPAYEKIELVVDPTTSTTTVAAPKPIADFIIGEHLPFALLGKLTGLSFISSFPVLILLFINLLTLLALIALSIRLSEKIFRDHERPWFVVSTFLFLGPLFTLASPQAKFVSGGVVGNLLGNFFIPLILLALYLGLRDKATRLIILSIALLSTLAYTHHLSTLILGFVVIGIALTATLARFDTLIVTLRGWLQTALRPTVGLAIGLVFAFAILVALPSYLDRSAIDSALGSPVKTTRTGLAFVQISNSLGIIKTAFALAGLVLLVFGFQHFRKKDSLAWALLVGWGGMLAIMAMRPDWVWLDIPSNRVGSYLAYPAALLAGWALTALIIRLRADAVRSTTRLMFIMIIGTVLANGLFENGAVLLDQSKAREAQEVFAASQYLSETTTADDIILKDHNYLAADAWMKLFFLRDYGYPPSRGLFSRYSETGNRRENCTMLMIASPNSTEGKRCFESTGTNYIVVNPTYDAVQFEKSPDFAKVYSSDHVAVFKRLK